ncbi:hypothetical protein JHK87_053298 [Glycine soja]|nr:hypothetical protein JHK87_053298 [Glycine soja]
MPNKTRASLPQPEMSKGNPFGEPDLCNQYGMAYAALSMAVCNMLILKLQVLI